MKFMFYLLFKTMHKTLNWANIVMPNNFISHFPQVVSEATNNRVKNFPLETWGFPLMEILFTQELGTWMPSQRTHFFKISRAKSKLEKHKLCSLNSKTAHGADIIFDYSNLKEFIFCLTFVLQSKPQKKACFRYRGSIS